MYKRGAFSSASPGGSRADTRRRWGRARGRPCCPRRSSCTPHTKHTKAPYVIPVRTPINSDVQKCIPSCFPRRIRQQTADSRQQKVHALAITPFPHFLLATCRKAKPLTNSSPSPHQSPVLPTRTPRSPQLVATPETVMSRGAQLLSASPTSMRGPAAQVPRCTPVRSLVGDLGPGASSLE
jgi:hypothetical protein